MLVRKNGNNALEDCSSVIIYYVCDPGNMIGLRSFVLFCCLFVLHAYLFVFVFLPDILPHWLEQRTLGNDLASISKNK